MPRYTSWLTALTLLVSTSALAQEVDAETGRQIKYKERTEIDFEGVDVTGELVKPQGAMTTVRRQADFNPLIRLREDFKAEMQLSVDEVK